jgi:DNA-binding NtrC family response regulator
MSAASVLLVDDERDFVSAMTKRLTKRDLEVSNAFDGLDALEALSLDDRIEVVILDVKMPGMSGVETLREIKRLYPLVEVIMLTGYATVETAIEGMKLGAYDYLMKPCDMDELLGKVGEAAEKRRKHQNKILEARTREVVQRRGQ